MRTKSLNFLIQRSFWEKTVSFVRVSREIALFTSSNFFHNLTISIWKILSENFMVINTWSTIFFWRQKLWFIMRCVATVQFSRQCCFPKWRFQSRTYIVTTHTWSIQWHNGVIVKQIQQHSRFHRWRRWNIQ